MSYKKVNNLLYEEEFWNKNLKNFSVTDKKNSLIYINQFKDNFPVYKLILENKNFYYIWTNKQGINIGFKNKELPFESLKYFYNYTYIYYPIYNISSPTGLYDGNYNNNELNLIITILSRKFINKFLIYFIVIGILK